MATTDEHKSSGVLNGTQVSTSRLLARKGRRTAAEMIGITEAGNQNTYELAAEEGEELLWQIRKALTRRNGTMSNRIVVEIQDSTAILRGTAASLAQKQLIEETVWGTPGIAEVVNCLQIG